jgi:outer membrane protein TolC
VDSAFAAGSILPRRQAKTELNKSKKSKLPSTDCMENLMIECKYLFAIVRTCASIIVTVLAIGSVAAQDSSSVASPVPIGTVPVRLWKFSAESSFHPPTIIGESSPSRARNPVRPSGIQQITLEQVKQAADPVASPVIRLGQISIEAAKQHRLAVQADYFPKFGASFANLHYTNFFGQVLAVRHPITGSTIQVPVPLISQNQTFALLTFTQPITPLFMVNQAVRIARADERIAMAKAGVAYTRNARELEVEETYFKLLIAQRRLISAESKVKSVENRPQYAAASIELVRESGQELELIEAKKALGTVSTEVRSLTASLNQTMGWPEDTELELAMPEPLIENVSRDDSANRVLLANPDVIEAEQTLVKARAASVISKLEYVPTVAAVSGYMFQNVIPAVRSNFGYGGVIASYNLFDFGKREHAVKEARTRVGMAEIALQLTKAKVAGDVKKTYSELERSRQLSQVAQKMGSSLTVLMNASLNPESAEVKAARGEAEIEMLEADLAHRKAFAHLKALAGSER